MVLRPIRLYTVGLVVTAVISIISLPVIAQNYDVLIRGSTVFDGSLASCKKGDVAIKGDKIVKVGLQAIHIKV